MNKKTKTFLIAAAVIVVIVALFLPNNNIKPGYKVEQLTCSEVSENQENDTKLNKISCNDYNQKIQEKTHNLILIARPSCGVCVQYVPILEKIVEEYDITINYFDTDTLNKTEYGEFYNSSDLYKSSAFGTPTLIITNNNEIVKYHIGYMGKKETIKWFKKVGVIK